MVTQRTPSIAREDYLQTILQLTEDAVPVIQARLAERLDVSAPSVSEAIRGLIDDDLVKLEDHRHICLTPQGRSLAENIVRRHRVAECILVNLLGMSWHEAHEDAHRLEHGLTDRAVDRAIEVLGNPTMCPHGNPIPGTKYTATNAIPITDLATGDQFCLDRIGEDIESKADVMAYLDERNFRPGTRGHVATLSPDGTLSVETEFATIAIGPSVGAHVYVTKP